MDCLGRLFNTIFLTVGNEMITFLIFPMIILFFFFSVFVFAEGQKNLTQTPHHYVLAHIALRQICMANPVRFFEVMGSKNRGKYLEGIWQQVRKNCDDKGFPSFSIEDVKVETTKIDQFPGIIIIMPTPQFDTECHMVGIVLRVNVKDFIENRLPEKPVAEYFTLEKGSNLDGSDRTVLCRWDESGTHHNYDTGPNPAKIEFMKAILEMLK
jgi:hypothetical protein